MNNKSTGLSGVPEKIVLDNGVILERVDGKTWESLTAQVDKDGHWERFVVYERK